MQNAQYIIVNAEGKAYTGFDYNDNKPWFSNYMRPLAWINREYAESALHNLHTAGYTDSQIVSK